MIFHRNAYLALFHVCISSLFFCSSCQSTLSEGTMQSIGPEGGSLHEDGGAIVAIPACALENQTKIAVDSYSSANELPENLQPHFLGAFYAAKFMPEGITFSQPVSITIPCSEELTPDTQFPIYTWDEVEQSWQETEFIATVDPDGYSYSANVTHFSTNSGGGTSGAGSPFKGFNMGDEQGCDARYITNQLNNWADVFKSAYGGVGGRDARGSCCWEIKGIELKVTYECPAIGPITRSITLDDMNDCDQVEKVNKSSGVVGREGGYTYQTITRCWKRVMPEVRISELPGNINLTCQENPDRRVNVRVTCGEEGIPRAEVNWSVIGVGEVSPTSVITSPSGSAETTFSVEEEGFSSVQAIVKSCQDEQTHFQTLNTNQACVDECDQMYLLLEMSFRHSGDGVPWNLTDVISAHIDFPVDTEIGQITSGRGEAGHNLSISSVRDSCSVKEIAAPSFALKIINGQATD